MIYENIWASVTVFCKEFIDQVKLENPQANVQFMDWENANMDELPDADLIGPASIMITDYGQEQIEVTFAVGVSTYTSDKNLFRHRKFVGGVFEAMRPENKVDYYDSSLAVQASKLVITSGTLLSPMTKSQARPWQYVQAGALLVPS